MTAGPVRIAGRSRDWAGRQVLWSVAEGARGRRWREATLDGASLSLARSLTLETGPDRRPMKLEIAHGGGLLTLHAEPGGLVHVNHVRSTGVHGFSLDTAGGLPLFDLPGSPMLDAALCWSLERELDVGAERELVVVRLWLGDGGDRGSLGVGTQDLQVVRHPGGHWSLSGSGLEPRAIFLDDDGLPLPEPTQRWPLDGEGGP